MRQRVLKEIDDAWNELISWQLPPYDDDNDEPGVQCNADGESLATLNLSGVSRRQVEHVGDIAGAWSKVGRLDADVAVFCDRLLNRLIRSVTATDCYGAATSKSQTSSGASRGPFAGRRVVVIEDDTGTRKVSVVAGANRNRHRRQRPTMPTAHRSWFSNSWSRYSIFSTAHCPV
jgi:hypothetical protein